MFNKADSPVCSACMHAEEADYEKVRAAMEEHPGLNAEQLAKQTEVAVECVKRMLDVGMITLATGQQLTCGMCGAPAISASKRLCQTCLDKLNLQVAKAQNQIQVGKKKAAQVKDTTARQAFDLKRRT
ncbi:MAG: hypothetical protein KA184_11335 [Candidatus Hydrogenedentes bacterium]|nr:hypothetical protein [Candidatus Hydrogenedentota bacterium]